MANLISLQLPLTHPGTYRVSFMAQASGLVTLEITTVLPIQHKGAQVQTDTNLDISQNIGRFINCAPVVSPTVQPIFLTETPKLSKISKSPGHDEQPVHTSDCGEKSLSSSLFSTPVKDTKDGPNTDDSVTEPESEDERGDGLITFHSLSVSSQLPSLSQDSISTFVLMRRMEAGFGTSPRGVDFSQHGVLSRSPSPPKSTPGVKRIRLEMN
ncbi:hypothetical protein EDC04DRAFT_2889114 [Pisolithus marmoratus]|nr:hypothetical protein EDC04DRAFT_2889114 [Pisolithus marmoratus]